MLIPSKRNQWVCNVTCMSHSMMLIWSQAKCQSTYPYERKQSDQSRGFTVPATIMENWYTMKSCYLALCDLKTKLCTWGQLWLNCNTWKLRNVSTMFSATLALPYLWRAALANKFENHQLRIQSWVKGPARVQHFSNDSFVEGYIERRDNVCIFITFHCFLCCISTSKTF